MKKRHALLLTGFSFVAIGGGLTFNPLMDYLQGKSVATQLTAPFSSVVSAQAPPAQQPDELISGKPVRIQIPSVGVDLAVAEGHFDAKAKTWTLSNDKAQYAVNTPLANNREGNTFIYGHNRRGVLRTLSHIKPGAEATVTTENGHQFVYQFSAAYETTPDDDSLFKYQGGPILTVQTCSGLRFENRQLFTFNFVKVI